MKFAARNDRDASSVFRVTAALLAVVSVPFLLYAAAPSWWSQRRVLVANAAPDDYAPANQGQVKNIARAAAEEMDARLTGGAGDEVHALISSWSAVIPETNDFAPIDLGQLKNVAKPFYDRLIVSGITDTYPWLKSLTPSDDFAVANIGQVKNLFSFEVPSANGLDDARGDRLAAGTSSANLALQAYSLWIWADQFLMASDFERNFPRRLTSLPAAISVAAGEHHLVVLGRDGTVWTWGENNSGQLGDGSNMPHTVPSAVPGLTEIVSVKGGAFHTLALRQDGTVAAWGGNSYGQLGTGDTNSSAIPVSTVGLDNIIKIAAGGNRSMALRVDGTVWTWGYDRTDGQILYHTMPSMIPDFADVIEVAAGYNHAVALKSDGTVWAWGSNSENQIANGNPWWIYQEVPFQVPGLPPISKVASRELHTLAIAMDGTVWAWGFNAFGQLGDGSADPRQRPIRVTGLTDVVAIATSYSYSLAMKADGTVWAWGDGATGTLPGSDRHVPQLVGLGLLDTNHNAIDDRWEMQYLGDLNQSADADFDGDGVSNRLEYLRGTNPTDYYNGVTPVVEIAGGNNQVGDPGAFLPKPFKVRVRNSAGQVLINAPVAFSVSSGTGGLAATPGIAVAQSLNARTDSNGEAFAYHALSDLAGSSTRTTATAGRAGMASSVTFRGVVKLSVPSPPPTPAPDPNSTPDPSPSPTSTPSSTATPVAPYRYAIIDLGANIYPIKVNNNGTILVRGFDADSPDGSRVGRWRGGAIEWLKYPDPVYSASAVDINDNDVVVGSLAHYGMWPSDEREPSAGLYWTAESAIATKVSAPSSFPGFGPLTYYLNYRSASFTAINNRNEIFGELYTGTLRGFLFQTIFVTNGARWTMGSTSPQQLSFASGVNDDPENLFAATWTGFSDSISRASSDHYIGRRITPGNQIWDFVIGSESGMIDGQPVDFDPRDVNEHGVIVGNRPGNGPMMIRTLASPPTAAVPDIQLPDTIPLAINDHVRPALPGQTSPTATPQPTPIPAPQVLAWTGNALVLWELQPDAKTWHPFGLEEMIPSMDGWDYIEAYDVNDAGLIIGTGWYADPSNPAAGGDVHGFVLAPVELMVDGNRDGEMSFDDPVIDAADITTEDKPYRFWLNDDDDGSAGEPGEHVPPVAPDFQDGLISSARDLEDFARLHVNLSAFPKAVESESIKVGFEWKDASGVPRIKLYRAVSPGSDYLTNESVASSSQLFPFKDTLGEVAPGAPLFMPQAFWTTKSQFSNVPKTLPTTWLLFEGSGEGKGQLVTTFWNNGHKIGEAPGVWLDIKHAKKMYQRAIATPESLIPPYDSNSSSLDEGSISYRPDVTPEFDPPPDEEKQCLIFVHGWKATEEDAENAAQTMFKRLWWQGYKGRFAAFRWPTQTGTRSYNTSEWLAWKYGRSLREYTSKYINQSIPEYRISVAAHSMGNIVTASALKRGMALDRYILMEAAIPAGCYTDSVNNYDRFLNAETKQRTPDTSSELGYRLFLQAVRGSVGKFVSFFNINDFALATGVTKVLGWPFGTNWEKNQVDYKPDFPTGVYSFDGSVSFFSTVEGDSRPIVDVHESLAFVARPRSKAAGAEIHNATVFGSVLNLQTACDFTAEVDDHSGQFTRPIQQLKPFYERLSAEVQQ